MARTNKDLEYAVDDVGGRQKTFRSFDAACSFAVSVAIITGRSVDIDVLCWSRAAARAWGGDDGVERYVEDPDASVHERITVKAHAIGRVA